jgi:hypothetical protein
MKQLIRILIAATILAISVSAQTGQAPAGQMTEAKVRFLRLSIDQQEAFLNTLVAKQQDGKMWAPMRPYIVATQTSETDHGVHCTSSSINTPQAGPASGEQWYGASTVCQDLISRGNATVLAFHDPDNIHAAYLVVLSCSEKLSNTGKAAVVGSGGASAPFVHRSSCLMQEPGQYGSMTIEEGKHGSFDVWVGAAEKLGAKPNASKFDVVEVKYSLLLDTSEGMRF